MRNYNKGLADKLTPGSLRATMPPNSFMNCFIECVKNCIAEIGCFAHQKDCVKIFTIIH